MSTRKALIQANALEAGDLVMFNGYCHEVDSVERAFDAEKLGSQQGEQYTVVWASKTHSHSTYAFVFPKGATTELVVPTHKTEEGL